MIDIAIVGGGPAGLSAAIEARMRKLSVTVIARPEAKGGLSLAPLIENYPGCPNVTGIQLLSMMKDHAQQLGTTFYNGKVTSILSLGESYGLGIGNDFLEARALILATGAKQPKLLQGEAELIGHGVSYCATCDGMLYRGKDVGVLGASDHAVSEANFLVELAGSVRYFGVPDEQLHPSIQVVESPIVSLTSENPVADPTSEFNTLSGVMTRDGTHYPLAGLFIEREQMAFSTLLGGLALEGRFIQVDREMRTNLPRVFAAGDCTGGTLQVSKAVGDGCVAAYVAAKELQA